ncbi:hypothetical protein PLICRDRAFT_174122 [Plicaturopsis crispa FD-325 SS-3]|nr:hypothetical protein PLICRDRAFT_174122 [Plicaturopsis crispa FD-325 SS-3]
MPAFVYVADLFLAGLALYFLKLVLGSKRLPAPLPPGPKAYPVIGNLLDMPTSKEWLAFTQWGQKYGDMAYAQVLGQPMVILNSAQIATDMLDKKSSIYSDRPVLPMGGELVGWKNTLVLVPYGKRHRTYRGFFHRKIGTHNNMKQYLPAEEHETHRFLRRVLEKPADLSRHIRHTAGAIILRISHGYEVQEHDDPFVELANHATEQFSLSTAPGAFLVDVLPLLRFVPSWFPGAGFQKTAKAWRKTLEEMVDKPHEYVKQQVKAGTAVPSFTSELLEDMSNTGDEEFSIKWSAASLYSGGADTTVSVIYAFFLAMTLFPEVQATAQAEIDAVIGSDRLPTFADRDRLPYVNALAKEVFRWNSVVPLSLPHRATEDNIHNGYFIPAGSLIITNIEGMLKDPRSYPNPSVFDPTRFIASEGKQVQKDPRTICFGFGRRICPGLNLADASVFISCAMSLAVFSVTKAVEDGVVIEPVVDKTPGTISHPVEYKCSIKPRSAKAVALVQAE